MFWNEDGTIDLGRTGYYQKHDRQRDLEAAELEPTELEPTETGEPE